ncbi:MAG: hypothetical protein HRT89_14155 [Lentisphaeria bacterium]|nr:hypothetical protein [Lentisphaeria bacterium]NQZ69199.1 hypothetical protein [Lentisphaeria bacterium]
MKTVLISILICSFSYADEYSGEQTYLYKGIDESSSIIFPKYHHGYLSRKISREIATIYKNKSTSSSFKKAKKSILKELETMSEEGEILQEEADILDKKWNKSFDNDGKDAEMLRKRALAFETYSKTKINTADILNYDLPLGKRASSSSIRYKIGKSIKEFSFNKFTLNLSNGEELTPNKTKSFILAFWTAKDPATIPYLKMIEKLQKEVKSIKIFAINIGDKNDVINSILNLQNLDIIWAKDAKQKWQTKKIPDEEIFKESIAVHAMFNVRICPATVIIKNGKVTHAFVGYNKEYRSLINKAIKNK